MPHRAGDQGQPDSTRYRHVPGWLSIIPRGQRQSVKRDDFRNPSIAGGSTEVNSFSFDSSVPVTLPRVPEVVVVEVEETSSADFGSLWQ